MTSLDNWIEREFAGQGVAVRHQDEPPIPGEPLMSMEAAKSLVRRAVVEIGGQLQEIHSALDDALGDTDVSHIEDDDELRTEQPVQWAAQKLAALLNER